MTTHAWRLGGRWPETHGLPTDHGHCRPHGQCRQQNPDATLRAPSVCMATSLDRQWWDIYIRVPESMSDAASAYLSSLGSTAVVFHEQALLIPQHEPCIATWSQTAAWTVLQGALPLDDTLPRQVAALQQWLRTCTWEDPGVQFYCRPLPDVDYLTQWQQFFPPLCLGERLMIRPPWDTSPVPSTMACLTLNPGPAFGTGTHPSTHLCLLMLMQCAAHYRGCRLLDI